MVRLVPTKKPEVAYAETEEHLATLVAKHGGDPAKALVFLRSIAALAGVAVASMDTCASRHRTASPLAS